MLALACDDISAVSCHRPESVSDQPRGSSGGREGADLFELYWRFYCRKCKNVLTVPEPFWKGQMF